MSPRRVLVVWAALCAALLAGCSTPAELVNRDEGRLTIFATTGQLADLARTLAPDAEVVAMVGPGGDPHTYQPSTRDIQQLLTADLVLWNGLNLEAQMVDQLTSRGDRQVAVGEAIPEDLLLDWPGVDAEGRPLSDPHIWNDPRAWAAVSGVAGEALARVDPANADAYRAAARGYADDVEAAGDRARAALAGVPAQDRLLITGHDAFDYLGRHLDLEVHATDFISANAQMSPDKLSALADLIVHRRVSVIFQDNQVNPQAIVSLREAVQSRGWEVHIADSELYADSLGSEAGVDTTLGAFEHNVAAIAAALTDQAPVDTDTSSPSRPGQQGAVA